MDPAVEARAARSGGTSAAAIYRMVARVLQRRHLGGGTLLDVGCGTGNLWSWVQERFYRYQGVDAVRYSSLPDGTAFVQANLDCAVPLPDAAADVVAAVETIEHLDNPRAFIRELVRLTKPGGWVVVTTPNQLSLLSLLTLVVKQRFSAFQDVHYPAHRSALLEVDLRRIADECGLTKVEIRYTEEGRIPGTALHYPGFLSRLFPRALSDNLLLIARTASR